MIHFLLRGFRKLRYLASIRAVPANNKRIAQVRVNGAELLVFCNEDVGRQIYFTHRYEVGETRWIKSIVKRDWLFFDVGANTGYYTMLFATLAPDGVVHSFEPSELNWHMLVLTSALNGSKNICINRVAASEVRGTTTFDRANDGAYSSMRHTGRKPSELIESVETIRLDDYVRDLGIDRIDLMKIDVEGAECLVLRGAAALLSSSTLAPRWLMIEIVDENLKSFTTSAAEIFAILKGAGYEAFVVNDDGCLRAVGGKDDYQSYNYIFRHSSAAS